MQQNFEVLRVFIPQDRLLSYNTDWNKFRDFCRTITDEQCAAAEQSSPSSDASSSSLASPATDPKKVFHQLVENLLKHAQP
ncbi:MAG TPA: hypothetical protein VK141_09645, partial [Nitrosomonas sp.]|nr:hypothetical protein [Nitrosomonas sp.]